MAITDLHDTMMEIELVYDKSLQQYLGQTISSNNEYTYTTICTTTQGMAIKATLETFSHSIKKTKQQVDLNFNFNLLFKWYYTPYLVQLRLIQITHNDIKVMATYGIQTTMISTKTTWDGLLFDHTATVAPYFHLYTSNLHDMTALEMICTYRDNKQRIGVTVYEKQKQIINGHEFTMQVANSHLYIGTTSLFH